MHFDLVISLCDGIGLARTSLALAGVKFDRYIGVEIDPVARQIADYRASRDDLPPIERKTLCSACGGTMSRLDAETSKFVGACEVCADTGGFVECHDMRRFSGWLLPDDCFGEGNSVLIVAGIPCTERSLANKNFTGEGRVGEDTDSGLIRHFPHILYSVNKQQKCRAGDWRLEWIVENVPSAADANAVYNRLLGCEPVEINAAWFGAQHRRRLFWSSWQITPPPKNQWSGEVFADIADKNPPGKRYDYVLWESARRKDGKPHRVGVLPTPSVLRQISKRGTMPQPKVYDGDNKMAAAQAGGSKGMGGLMVESEVSPSNRVSGKDGKVGAVRAGRPGGSYLVDGGFDRGGDSNARVVSDGGKTPTSTRVMSQDGKMRTITAKHMGSPDNKVAIASSLQDRVHAPDAKMKTVPSMSGGRTEGFVAVGSLPDGGGDQATVADADSKMYSLKSAAVKIGDRQPGRSDDVMDDKGKVNSVRTGVNKQAKVLSGTATSSAAVVDGKSKAGAIRVRHGGGTGYKAAEGGRIERREFVVDGEVLELDVVVGGARCLTVGEIERLFGLPTGDTAAPGVSKTARIRAIGGGWDVRQMAHALKQIDNKRRELV